MGRYFVGIQIPDPVGNKLLQVIERIAPQVPAKRWYGKEQFHMTTNFLGDLHEQALRQAIEGLNRVVPNHPRFDLSLREVGMFPKAKVVWCDVQPSERLMALQHELRMAFRPLGAEAYQRQTYVPHITLARTGDLYSVRLDTTSISSEFAESVWTVEEICLYESMPTLGGAQYPVIHRVTLV